MTVNDARTPAGGVVIIGPLSDATQVRLTKAAHGKLRKVSDSPLTQVLEKADGNLRQLSKRINQLVGTEGVVAPMLADPEGNQLFPTGKLQVRFKEPPSEKSLTSFANKHKVEVAQRNKWSPQQVEFAVRTDDMRYFPDVAAELKKDSAVLAAWPDVSTAFRRGST